MKLMVGILCVAFLFGALNIPAFALGDGASATFDSEARLAPNHRPDVTQPDAGLPFRFDHIAMKQGLSNLDAWGIVRDDRGFMWFGTLDGLYRFDGYQMRVFRHERQNPLSLSENTIRTLVQDRTGSLWIGTWTGGLDRFDRETESFTHFRHNPGDPGSLSNDSVFAILEDHAGALWLGTRGGGLDRFDPQTQTFTHYRHDPANPQSLSNDNVFALLEDQSGALWVSTDGGLNRLDANRRTFTAYRHNPADPGSLSQDDLRGLYLDSDGTLWVSTFGGGLDRLDLNQLTTSEPQSTPFTHYRNDPNDPQSLSDNTIMSVHRDARGGLWVGTLNGGLNRLDEKTGAFQHFLSHEKDAQGFAAHRVYAMAEDTRAMWFATDDGVYLLDLQPKSFYALAHNPDDPNSLAGTVVDFVYQDAQGILWVSTTHSGLNKVDRTTHSVTHYRHNPNNPDSMGLDEIWEIAPSGDGKLWLATYGAGLDQFDPKTEKFTHYRHDPADEASLASDVTTSVYEDPTGVVWVGTWDAGLDRFDPKSKSFTHFPHIPSDPNSLSDSSIMTIYQDRSGALWVGTVAGALNRIAPDTGTIIHYPLNSQNQATPESVPVSAFHEDRNGAIWVATWGDGLYRLSADGSVARHYSHEDGLPSDAVFSLYEDASGLFWLSTSLGLSKFDPQTETFRNYDESDGLPGDSFKQAVAFQGPSGELSFGGKNGLVSFFPDQIHDSPIIPPVVITDFLLANEPVPISDDSVLPRSILETKDLTLSYQERVISLGFSALNYIAPQKNRYRYMLEGFDQGWTEVGSDRRLVTYTNLDPGQYVFRVLGSNNDGIWNEQGASLALTITPPWWATIWFRLLIVLLGAGVLAAVFAGQRRNAVIQQHRLEAMVVERTHELQDARTQINTLFNNSPLGICVATVEGKILGVNRAMQRITGYPEDQLLQTNVSILYASPEHRMILLEQLNGDGFLSDYGIQLRRRDGSLYYASINLSRLEMAGQDVILGITDDITDQVEVRHALTTLHKISHDLASMPDLPMLLESALQQLGKIVDFQRAALMLLEEDEESLTIYAYFSPTSPPAYPVHHIPVNRWPFLQTALRAGETTYIPDMQASAAIPAELDRMQMGPWAAALKASRSWLGLPLVSGERTVGLLTILGDDPNHYDAGDIELARTFADQLTVAVDNIYLKEIAGVTAAAEERSRIARELHDSVTQALYSMTLLSDATIMALTAGKLETVEERLGRIKDVAREAMTEMRWLIYKLHPSVLADAGLAAALQERLDAVEARSGVKAHFEIQGEPRLPPASERELFGVAQEGLNNALRHAHASQVWVMLDYEASFCRLTIRDDGVGFAQDAAGRYSGYGLANMRERLAKINGRLKIVSELSKGTTLEIEVDQ